MHKEIFEYPPIMNASHVMEYLGWGKTKVYELFNRSDFPALDVPGRKSIRRDDFEKWLLNSRKTVKRGA